MILDENMVMISALQHIAFCKRQCALIHIEQQWADNFLTASGDALHQKVDSKITETRKGVRYVTALRIASHALGLTGIMDMLELHYQESPTNLQGVTIATKILNHSGFWAPYPVEYKRGKPKSNNIDAVQLCAQALCLEEMLNLHIPEASLYYGTTKRREVVQLDTTLRNYTINLSKELHAFIAAGITPSATPSKQCLSCSMYDICQPEIFSRKQSTKAYVHRTILETLQ